MSPRTLTALGVTNLALIGIAIALDSRLTYALAAVGCLGVLVLLARKGAKS